MVKRDPPTKKRRLQKLARYQGFASGLVLGSVRDANGDGTPLWKADVKSLRDIIIPLDTPDSQSGQVSK